MPRVGRPPRRDVYLRLDEAVADLHARFGGLPPPGSANPVWDEVWRQEAHHSTAIEGNTLLLRDVDILLREGRATGARELSEYMEVRGYADAAVWVYEHGLADAGRRVTMTDVRRIHQMAMTPVWEVAPHPTATSDETPGSFRVHDIARFPGGMQPPPWTEVQPAMTSWIGRAAQPSEGQHPIEALADLHASFERIHPFLDGNGRAGRLVLNLMLLRLGYAPAIIRKRERSRYLRLLGIVDRGNPGPLGEFIARSVLDVVHLFIAPAVAGAGDLMPLISLADDDTSARALRAAAERGRLRAQRDERGHWRSTRAWVDAYRRDRYRRQPKGNDERG